MKKFSLYNAILFLIVSFNVCSQEIEILSDVLGTGPLVEFHSKISVHYRGTLEDGTVFDSSFKRNKPFIFQIGNQQVIQGWEIGLMGMRVGGKRKIKIPPELAYGKNGAGDLIPPNATLIFEIDIIGVEPPRYKLIDIKDLELNPIDNLIIIDIRSKSDWKKTGVIKDSKKITAFNEEGEFQPNFLKSFQKIANTTSNVLFVSKKGDISSILANGFVEQLGFRNIYSLKGGIDKLINSNYPLK